MRDGKRVARPDDRLIGTPPTAQEGAVRIISRAQVHDRPRGLKKKGSHYGKPLISLVELRGIEPLTS